MKWPTFQAGEAKKKKEKSGSFHAIHGQLPIVSKKELRIVERIREKRGREREEREGGMCGRSSGWNEVERGVGKDSKSKESMRVYGLLGY